MLNNLRYLPYLPLMCNNMLYVIFERHQLRRKDSIPILSNLTLVLTAWLLFEKVNIFLSQHLIYSVIHVVSDFRPYLVYNWCNRTICIKFIKKMLNLVLNCRRKLKWRSWLKRRKDGRIKLGLRPWRKWNCSLLLLTSKSYQGFWGWQRSASSSCYGVKKRWAISICQTANFAGTLLHSSFLVDGALHFSPPIRNIRQLPIRYVICLGRMMSTCGVASQSFLFIISIWLRRQCRWY